MDIKDPLEQLTECIRDSNRPVGLFLGAGCGSSIRTESGEPLVPDTVGLTEEIEERAGSSGLSKAWEQIITRVEHDDEINIEDVLSEIRGILQYTSGETLYELSYEELTKLEGEICEGICEVVDVELPSAENGYKDLATWLASVDREQPVEIFTTNYDLLLEQALESRNITYFDGFVGGYRPFFDSYVVGNDEIPPRWIRLWKIHGSINWISQEEDDSVRVWRSDDISGERAVIHPSHLKYDESRKMPYLALIDRLEDFLNRSRSVMFIVGYSFGDEHLNDIILQALQGTPSSNVFAFLYSDIDENPVAEELALRQSNFTVYGPNRAVIGTEIVKWDTVESDSDPKSNVIGMDWEEREDDVWDQQFLLGDFREFGKFFRAVTGTT